MTTVYEQAWQQPQYDCLGPGTNCWLLSPCPVGVVVQAFLSRLLLMLGSFVIMCLLLF